MNSPTGSPPLEPSPEPTPAHKSEKSTIIARNSLWYALELVLELLSTVGASILIARVIGPQKLGYFQYILWLTSASSLLGTLGIPATARKFIAEHLGKGEISTVRSIFLALLRVQFLLSLSLTSCGLALVWAVSPPDQYWISTFLVAAMFPSMLRSVPAAANLGREEFWRNLPGSIAGAIVYLAGVFLSLSLGWDLLGVAIVNLLQRIVDLVLKLVPVYSWVMKLPPAGSLSPQLRRRMISFSTQGIGVMLIRMVVWDRSDVLFLKWLNPDIRQVTFFALTYNLTERAFMLPNALSAAVASAVLAESSRGSSRLRQLAHTTTRYMLIAALPLFVGLALVSDPLVRFIYGNQYLPAIPVLAVAALCALPRVFSSIAQPLLEATERQNVLLKWGVVGAVLNVIADILLTGPLGAIGAVIACGLAQGVYAAGVWRFTTRHLDLQTPWTTYWKPAFAILPMGACVLSLLRFLPPMPAVLTLVIAVPASAVVYTIMLRILGALDTADRKRLEQVLRQLPNSLQPAARIFLNAVVSPPTY